VTAAAERHVAELKPSANLVRLAGSDRFESAAEVAAASFSEPTMVSLSDGTFATGSSAAFGPLLAAVLAAHLQAPLLLTDDARLPASAQAYLVANRASLDTALLVAVPASGSIAEQVRNIL
jgi:hypothetical protein